MNHLRSEPTSGPCQVPLIRTTDSGLQVILRCGRCLPCSLFLTNCAIGRVRLQASHSISSFVDHITFADEHLPSDDLLLRDPDWVKRKTRSIVRRLERRHGKGQFKYWIVWQLGETTFRLHAHMILMLLPTAANIELAPRKPVFLRAGSAYWAEGHVKRCPADYGMIRYPLEYMMRDRKGTVLASKSHKIGEGAFRRVIEKSRPAGVPDSCYQIPGNDFELPEVYPMDRRFTEIAIEQGYKVPPPAAVGDLAAEILKRRFSERAMVAARSDRDVSEQERRREMQAKVKPPASVEVLKDVLRSNQGRSIR